MDKKHLYEFDGFALDLKEKSLKKEGNFVSITPRVFSLMEMLVINHARIVEKDELMETVWADSFVEESNLTYSIWQLRKILDDDIHEPKFIETIPRRGYRFIAEVKSRVETDEQAAKALKYGKGLAFAILSLAAIVGLLLLAGSKFLFDSQPVPLLAPEKNRKVLAILSFTNLNPNPESDYLGFAFADTLNTKLTSMNTFNVFPSSLMAKYKTPQEFLGEQKAAYIVTGTYLRENRKLNITAQVLNVLKNQTLFQDSFVLDEEDLSQTSEIIARRLINELRLRPKEIQKYADMSEVNPDAYVYFLKGIEQYSRSRLSESIENLEKAVTIEPNFAVAWDKLGSSYLVSASTHFGGEEYYAKAEKCYRKAISLDDQNTLPQLHLTNILTETNRKDEAVKVLMKLSKTEPENPMVWWELSYAYRFAGNLDASIEAGEKAHQVDPGFFLNAAAPNYYLYIGDYQKFKDELSRRTDSAYIKFYQGFAEYYLGNKESARRLFDDAYQLDSNSMQAQIGKAFSEMISGEDERARNILLKIERVVVEKKVSDGEGIYKIAQAFAVLGDKTKALALFDLSVDKGFFCYPYFLKDPLINNLRNERKFKSILGKSQTESLKFRS